MEKTHINYADFLNFGTDDEIIALSQFVDNIKRNLPTINLQLHRLVCVLLRSKHQIRVFSQCGPNNDWYHHVI